MIEKLRAALYDALLAGDDLTDTLMHFLEDRRTSEVFGEGLHKQSRSHPDEDEYDPSKDGPCQRQAAAAIRVIRGLEAYPSGALRPADVLMAQTEALAGASPTTYTESAG